MGCEGAHFLSENFRLFLEGQGIFFFLIWLIPGQLQCGIKVGFLLGGSDCQLSNKQDDLTIQHC